MTRYKPADFEEDDSSSVGSVHLGDNVTSGTTHIRYHTGSVFWRSRTRLERFLLATCLFLLTVVAVLAALVAAGRLEPAYQVIHVGRQTYDERLCLTPPCIKVAATVLSALDSKVDPCTDFYQYACGGWIKANPLPEGKSMWGTFGKLEQQNQVVLKNVLEKPVSDADSSAEAKAKLYYESCMDVNETIAAVGAKPLLDLLGDAGGWNVSGEFNVSSWSFQRTMQILQNKYDMGGLFSWAVGEDDRNSTKHIIQIDQGGLTLPTRDYYLNKTANEKVLMAYLEYMTKIGVLLGGEQNETIKQMADIIHFETLLAEITIPSDERRDEESLYNLMSVEELQNLAPFMDWLKYLNDAFSNVNQTILMKDTVVVYAPKYLENLTTLIDNFTSTDDGKIILNNYLVWQTVRTLTPCLSRPFRDAYNILRKALVGSDSLEESWRYCVADTGSSLGFAVGAMFVREAFHGESKPLAEEMINRVKAAFRKNLRKVKWMDPETQAAADSKADAITDMIGFPDYILNPEELDAKYADLEIRPREYFQNNIRVNRYNLHINLQRLRQPVNKTRWSMTPPTVNAYYTPTKNQIVFPAGILQAPFYDKAYPRSLNFGAMGVVMGHELTHAFDDEGREYDKNGNLHKWWDNGTIERFKEKAECLVDQYSSYKAGEHNLNGKQVLGENIADNGGLKAAYTAYRDWVGEAGEELPLPGINFTHSQLFFLGFTQVWCSANTNEASALQIEKDPHSPAKFRVIGPLSNSPEFAKLFRCSLGSRMNPEKKCEVW